ncbi:hypothetical protein M9H77_23666 [Catharanthus roseus]|uniref:Uncharacterized protein n=1 Tax=Catharanthus roseus TaxID=4058 RepID=A0ACC0AY34_CATRO|nr:hypothetical protein M9H77_23666 [Catharanthus roseus]
MVHHLFIVLAREPKQKRLLPTVLDLRPGILPLSNPNQHHCIGLEQLSGRRPFRAQIRYRFILHTWSSLTTLHGLVKKINTKQYLWQGHQPLLFVARPMNEQNPTMKVPSRNLKMPPDAESPGFPREAPSMVKTTGALPSCFHHTIVQHFTSSCLKVEGKPTTSKGNLWAQDN